MNIKSILSISLISSFATAAFAGQPISYTDWTTASAPGVNATAGGTLNVSSGTVNVTYSGEFAFTQLNNNGTQYWTEGAPAPYTGNSVVGNAPSTTDIVALSEPAGLEHNSITFSQPVLDPIMLINSLGGGPTVTYAFNQSFTLLSAGTGYWGGNATTLTESGNDLIGHEGAGAIEFIGTYSSISWDTGGQYGGEYWNGFTIGSITDQTPAGSTPDAATTVGLLGMSLSCLLGFKRANR